MLDTDYEWAGIFKVSSDDIVADYVGNGVSDKKLVCCSFLHTDESECTVTEIIKGMFNNPSEFIVIYNSTDNKKVHMHISWDYIADFLSKYIDGRKSEQQIIIAGKIRD